MFEAEVNPAGVTRADLVVCIPSYNESDTISYPTRQSSEGLAMYFPDRESVIINCDNNSVDNTKQVFLDTQTRIPKIYLSTPPGVKGKGNNFRNLFRKVVALGAKAIVVVDADLKSITPEWIKHLGEPLFKGFSFVAPLYVRHKYDATITNGIAYPMSRALYGRRVRQPIGGEFGLSGPLAEVYLNSPVWDEAVANFGIDIWMTTLAMNQGVQVCQAFVGRPKIHRAKDPEAALGPMFRQVVETIFSLMTPFQSHWLKVKYSRPTAIFGFGLGEVEAPPEVNVNGEKLFQAFHKGFLEFNDLWRRAFARDVFAKIHEMKGMKPDVFNFPTVLWARILYDTAVAFRDRIASPDTLVDSLVPLYFGRTFSFVKKTAKLSTHQVEELIEEDCLTFEMTKPYLVKRWMAATSPA
jgi:glycosyltransferase involved in cell wall biosynthesis